MNGWDLDTGKINNLRQNMLGTESLITSSCSCVCVCVRHTFNTCQGENTHLEFKTKHSGLQETIDF